MKTLRQFYAWLGYQIALMQVKKHAQKHYLKYLDKVVEAGNEGFLNEIYQVQRTRNVEFDSASYHYQVYFNCQSVLHSFEPKRFDMPFDLLEMSR